jgi:hypothetical protein
VKISLIRVISGRVFGFLGNAFSIPASRAIRRCALQYNVQAMDAQRQRALGLALLALLIILIVLLRRFWSAG